MTWEASKRCQLNTGLISESDVSTQRECEDLCMDNLECSYAYTQESGPGSLPPHNTTCKIYDESCVIEPGASSGGVILNYLYTKPSEEELELGSESAHTGSAWEASKRCQLNTGKISSFDVSTQDECEEQCNNNAECSYAYTQEPTPGSLPPHNKKCELYDESCIIEPGASSGGVTLNYLYTKRSEEGSATEDVEADATSGTDATSDTVSTTPNDSTGQTGQDQLSGGMIAFIVVIVISFLCMFIGSLWMWAKRKKKKNTVS